MTKTEKIQAALEIFSNSESIREMGIKAAELAVIRDRINVVITELEKAEMRMGLYEVNGRQFKEPLEGPASEALQAEIDIHNDYTDDNKTKSDYFVSEIDE